MNEHVEIEYKILITKEILEDLLKRYPHYKEYSQTNFYFLSDELSKRLWSLRIRYKDDQYEMTLKRPIKNHRLETNIIISSIDKELLLNGQYVDNEITRILKEEHIDLSSLDTSHSLTTHRYDIEENEGILSLDISEYNGIIDYELEYEVENEEEGFKRFLEIIKPYHLKYTKNCKSKTQRVLESL